MFKFISTPLDGKDAKVENGVKFGFFASQGRQNKLILTKFRT